MSLPIKYYLRAPCSVAEQGASYSVFSQGNAAF